MERSFLPVPDPVAFKVFGLDIRWYGIMVVLGMICAVLLSQRRAPKYGIDPERVLDVVLWAIPLGVVGARAYYVIFEWSRYKDDFMQVFNMRAGGLAIHGGLIVGILTAFIITRRWGQTIWRWMDIFSPGIALGQAIGRWGNYFNSEAHGGPTTLPWAIYADGELVHPTFLYESLWCLLLCLFLLWFDAKGKKKFEGQIFLLYGILYSVERFFVEALRTDSLYIGPLRQAQMISIGVIAAALIAWYFLSRRPMPDYAAEASAVTAGDTDDTGDTDKTEKENEQNE